MLFYQILHHNGEPPPFPVMAGLDAHVIIVPHIPEKRNRSKALEDCTNSHARHELNGSTICSSSHQSQAPQPICSETRSSVRQYQPTRSPDVVPDEAQTRRQRRYSLAEHALATTLQNCAVSEASTQELQIRALEKATSLLGAYAEDAKERVGRLRAALADHEVDRDTHQALKQERWMEEKRQVAVAEVADVIQQQLVSLSQPVRVVSPAVLPSDAETRRRANLQRFFESSHTRTRTHAGRPHSMYSEPSTRRMTLDNVTPMRLRTSFMSMTSRTFKPRALDAQQAVDNIPLKFQSTPARSIPSTHPPLNGIHERTNLPRISEQRESSGGKSIISHGTATIFPTNAHQATDPVVPDIDVSIPDYALDLFTNFDIDYTIPPLRPIPTPKADLLSESNRQIHSLLEPPEARAIYKPRSRLSLRKPSFQRPPCPVEGGLENNNETAGHEDCNIMAGPARCLPTTSLDINISGGITHPELITNKIRKRFSAVLRRR